MNEKVSATDTNSATVIRGTDPIGEILKPQGRYRCRCFDYNALARGPNGELLLGLDGRAIELAPPKWEDVVENLVPTAGKNFMLDTVYKSSAYTAAIVMGLKGTGTAVIADTQASHASWNEVGLANAPTYTGNRKSITMGNAAAGVSTAPQQSFAITSLGTVAGLFVNAAGSATKDTTTGTLLSVGDFTGGNKVVANLDTLLVDHNMTLA